MKKILLECLNSADYEIEYPIRDSYEFGDCSSV